jgi:lysozyme
MPRQDVVLNMLFNLGLPKFLAFRKMIEALRLANYDQAATEMLDSKWAIQVGIRAKELAEIMRTGRYL